MRRRLLLLVIPVAVIVAVFALQDQLDRGAAMDRPAPPADDQQYVRLREAMVREQIEALASAIKLSRAVVRNINQNLVFAFGFAIDRAAMRAGKGSSGRQQEECTTDA